MLDTNTLVRGMYSSLSPAGRVLEGCRSRFYRFLLSKAVFAEYVEVLNYEEIRERNYDVHWKSATLLVMRLKYVSVYLPSVSVSFDFRRDPDEAKFLELAIAGNATHLVTHDRDLLSLRSGHTEVAKRLRRRMPRLSILTAADFLSSMKSREN